MELYQFSWGSGSDEECFSFFANADRESIINLLSAFQDADGDVRDYDELENYAAECGVEMNRYFHEEPTYIHENELE